MSEPNMDAQKMTTAGYHIQARGKPEQFHKSLKGGICNCPGPDHIKQCNVDRLHFPPDMATTRRRQRHSATSMSAKRLECATRTGENLYLTTKTRRDTIFVYREVADEAILRSHLGPPFFIMFQACRDLPVQVRELRGQRFGSGVFYA